MLIGVTRLEKIGIVVALALGLLQLFVEPRLDTSSPKVEDIQVQESKEVY